MKKRLSSKQFENMIVECVDQVLAESRQPQNRRVTMNEAQMHNFVRQIVNEELENEGVTGRIAGGIKGAAQAAKGFFNKHRLIQQNKNSEVPKKKVVTNNNTSWQHKLKQTISNQAADSDRNQELNKLIKKLNNLCLNGYFDKRDDIKKEVNNLINDLEYFMKYENGQTRGQYKRNFGVDHPDKIRDKAQPKETLRGMNPNFREKTANNLIMSR
jgi:hypothetical protein